MTIVGFWWFIGALAVMVVHCFVQLHFRRDARERLARWAEYNEQSQRRHDEFITEMRRWRGGPTNPASKRGQA